MKNLALVAALMAIAAISHPAQAGLISVTNTTTATTIFSDDGFEDDTVGNNANAPAAGTWSGTGVGVITANAAAPGPYDGANYLKVNRTGNQATGATDAAFSAAVATGETLRATFAYQYGSTAGKSSSSFRLMSGTSVRSNIVGEPDFA